MITGGTGWVGSHIVDKAIELGLRVRLAYRDLDKAKALVEGLQGKYGKDKVNVQLCEVADFTADGAYDEAVKGVQGVIHAASVLSFSDKWDDVVPPTIRGYELMLEAAAKEPGIKRFVLTSSSCSLGMPNVEKDASVQHFTTDTWNENSVRRAQEQPNGWDVYAASKVKSEQRAWQFVKEQKPSFVLNAVLPNMCAGGKAPGSTYMSTGNWFPSVINEGKTQFPYSVPSQYAVDVDDVAYLHVIGLMREDVQNERILAFSEMFSWDRIIDIGKKVKPDGKSVEKTAFTAVEDNTQVDLQRTRELLEPYGGLKSLEHTVKRNLDIAV